MLEIHGADALVATFADILSASATFKFQGVDLCDKRSGCLDLAVVRRAKDFPGKRSNTQHVLSVSAVLSVGDRQSLAPPARAP